MALGNPFLATVDASGVVRMFELVSGVFVQTGSLGTYVHNPDSTGLAAGGTPTPFMDWSNDDDSCLLIYTGTASQLRMAAFNKQAEAIGAGSVLISSTSRSGAFQAARIFDALYLLKSVELSSGTKTWYIRTYPSAAPDFTAETATASPNTTAINSSGLTVSPDSERLLVTFPDAPMLMLVTSGPTTFPPTWDTSPPDATPDFSISADLVGWSTNGEALVFADTALERAQSWSYDGTVFNFHQELPMLAGTPKALAFSPDGRFLAISALDGTTYSTRLYRRTGNFFGTHQTISGFGKALSWTSDGLLLVDALTPICYERGPDDVFAEKTGAMANVGSGIIAQAVSKARVDAFTESYFYEFAIGEVANGGIDTANVKMTLLTDSAFFDATDSSFALATNSGAWEVTTGGWPAGGVVVPITGTEVSAEGFALIAAPVERIAITSGLTARHALIYDATNDIPLVFIDLLKDRSVAQNRKMVFDFRDGDLLKFRR